jgi:hypothetical protein
MTHDPDIPQMQRNHEERLRQTRRFIIAETEAGFEVHEWTMDGVAPWHVYPVKETAASRLLQLMGIDCAIVPQCWPEAVEIASVERRTEQ